MPRITCSGSASCPHARGQCHTGEYPPNSVFSPVPPWTTLGISEGSTFSVSASSYPWWVQSHASSQHPQGRSRRGCRARLPVDQTCCRNPAHGLLRPRGLQAEPPWSTDTRAGLCVAVGSEAIGSGKAWPQWGCLGYSSVSQKYLGGFFFFLVILRIEPWASMLSHVSGPFYF